MHIVHHDNRYSSVTAAATSGDPKALAVIGVFFKVQCSYTFSANFSYNKSN